MSAAWPSTPPGVSTTAGDPADRIIIATALDEQLRLATGDARIRKSGLVETIW